MRLSRKLTDLQIIYLLAIVNAIMLIICYGTIICPDTPTYVDAWHSISLGRLDMWRTPTYPIFLGLLQKLAGTTHCYFWAICIQHLLFVLAVGCFYKVAVQATNSKKISCALTMVLVLFQYLMPWNNMIMTESLSVSGTICLIYALVLMYTRSSGKLWVVILFWLLFLVFLRPSLIYLVPVLLVIGVLWMFVDGGKKRKVALSVVSCVVLVTLAQGAYMKDFQKNYGVFASSGIGVLNQYWMARNDGLMDLNMVSDEQYKEYIQKDIAKDGIEKDLFEEARVAIEIFGLEKVQESVTLSNQRHLKEYIKNLLHRFLLGNVPMKTRLFVDAVYLLMAGCLILLLWRLRMRKPFWFVLLLFMLGGSNIIVTAIGAQAVSVRLILPSFPIYLWILGLLCKQAREGSA